MAEIVAIKQFLDSHKVHISTDWLEDCIKWCKEEALPPNHTTKDLKEKVFEQWLLLDLRDVELSCLPPNLSTKQKYFLSGTYFLQIMEIVDISKPKYWQIQKIRNETPKNVDSENMSSKRVLMLLLTDGVQEVKGVELKPIPALNLNLSPGIKVKVMGPITVRHGRLMLEEHNVKVIGGEVDTLLVSNAAENILARTLNLPVNPNPIRVPESIIATTDQLNNSGASQYTQNQSIQNVSNNRQQTNCVPNNQIIKNNSNSDPNRTHIQNPKNIENAPNNQFNDMDNFFENEDRINEEIELIMQMEREMENASNHVKKILPRKTPDMFDDMEIDDYNFERIEIPHALNKNKQESKPISEVSTTEGDEIHDDELSRSLEEGIDVFEKIDLDIRENPHNLLDNVQNMTSGSSNSNFRNDSEPFITKKIIQEKIPIEPKTNIWPIHKLKANLPNINNGKFRIMVKFKNIIKKLTVSEDKFYLVVEVQDDSDSIVLEFDDEVVANLAGCTAADLVSMKSQIEDNVFEARVKILQVLKNLKDNLLKLNNLADIRIEKSKIPVLIKIL